MNSETKLKDRGLTPHLALVAVQLMFGTWPIVGKVVLRSMSSTSLLALRLVGAALCFMLLRVKLGVLRIMPRRDLGWLVACSMLGVALNQLLFIKGLALTTVINANLLGTTIPVFTLVVSIAFGYDKISLRRSVGIGLAACGVIYLVNPLRADFSAQTNTGNLLIVTNCVLYGAYIALSKDLFKRYGALNVITWMFCIRFFGDNAHRRLRVEPRPATKRTLERLGSSDLHYSGPDLDGILPKRLGPNPRITQHGGNLYLSAAADRVWSSAGASGREIQLANSYRQPVNLRRGRGGDQPRPQPSRQRGG